MNAAGGFRFVALLCWALSAGCQTGKHGGDPAGKAAGNGETGSESDIEGPVDSAIVDAEFETWGEETGLPESASQPERESGPRISVRGDDGEWEVLSDDGGASLPSASLPSWVDRSSTSLGSAAPAFVPGAPPPPDFERIPWEENPRKARWQARDENRYLFFAFLSTELGNASARLQQDLFASQSFHDLAREHLVLTYLDYPRAFGIQSDEILRERYYRSFKDYLNIHGFPSAVLLDPGGNVICRFSGYSKRRSVAAMVSEMQDAIGRAGRSRTAGLKKAAE